MVVVTTRSKETEKITGNSVMYELKGEEDSWRLFQLMAFEKELDQASTNCYGDLINIGQEIVKICAYVPLAIRVVGRLLYGQDISKWLAIQELLPKLREQRDWIKSILKLSYHNLDPLLKSCLSYCCLFPKDYNIEKEVIISLWIAQGYIVPLEKDQSIEDAGEEYFSVLLGRCFFHHVEEDEYGELFSFKLHDLVHDIALELADKEICSVITFPNDLDKVIRHVFGVDYQSYCSTMTCIRTFILADSTLYSRDLVILIATCRRLRSLDLSSYHGELPASIGKLIHLRYLNLTMNWSLEVLPDSITELFNLQTLILYCCYNLKELPRDLRKLVNLRELGIQGCRELDCMPWGMGRLTNLCKLPMFVVKESNSSLWQHGELKGLKPLKKLRGAIQIVIKCPSSGSFVKNHGVNEVGYISDMEHLRSIMFIFKREDGNEKAIDYGEEELLGALQPHSNLTMLEFDTYSGVRMPRWADGDNLAVFLPNLVSLELSICLELQSLSSLGKLRFLESLRLRELPNLEYIESSYSAKAMMVGSSVQGLQIFPRLVFASLRYLPKLKGWFRPLGEMVRDDNQISSNKEPQHSSPIFPELKYLVISYCPELTSFPNCPKLTELNVDKLNERLRMTERPTSPKLELVTIDNMTGLRYLLLILTCLTLLFNTEVESLTDFRQVLCDCLSSLPTIEISLCSKMTVFGGLCHLNALKSLTLSSLPMLNLADEESDGNSEGEGESMALGSLCHTLEHLQISSCQGFQTFPKWMRKLTSLQQLKVRGCSYGGRLAQHSTHPPCFDY